MTTALIHWLQLALTEGIGPILTRRIVIAAGSAEAACAASIDLLNNVEGIGLARSRRIAAALRAARGEAQAEAARAAEGGITLLCFDDESYPPLLRSIPDPPAVLYMRGALEPRDLNAVAIVGSRRCSFYGREQAERFAALLAGAGLTVVSGGARGVDSSAHRGAISHPMGRTIAVLGSGVDVAYPPENAPLFDLISKRGAVLSEFPLGTPPNKENFPRRNRIVSGISRGVLVVEADERSGALITARQACDDHGRPVFAMPGRVDNPLSAGPHQLIRDGAVLTSRIEDILEGLGPLPHDIAQAEPPMLFDDVAAKAADIVSEAHEMQEPDADVLRGLTQTQAAVISGIGADGPATIDTIIERSGLPAEIVVREMTFLTLKGRVRRSDGYFELRR